MWQTRRATHMPRNDLKAYETLTARIPQDLVDAARHYASLHRCTVSDLIRDSLQMYLDADGPGRASGSGTQVLQGQTEVIQEVLHQVLQGQTEVIQEVRRGYSLLAQVRAEVAMQGQTEVRQGADSLTVARAEGREGQTTGGPRAPVVTRKGQAEVRQEVSSTPAIRPEVLQGQTTGAPPV